MVRHTSEMDRKIAEILNGIYHNEVKRVVLSYKKYADLIAEIKKIEADKFNGVNYFLAIQEIEVLGDSTYCVFSKKQELPKNGGDIVYVDFKNKKVLKSVVWYYF